MIRYYLWFVLLSFLLSTRLAFAQSDTISKEIISFDKIAESTFQKDSTATTLTIVDSFDWEKKHRKNAKRAGLYSAVLPGLGQIYNRSYWRVGIVYAAMGTGTGFIIYNMNEYNSGRKEIAARSSNSGNLNPEYTFLNDYQLQQTVDYHKNNLDLSVILTGVGYILQIIEAISYNHIKDFDVTPDISMRFKASMLPNNQIGIGLAFNFNKNERKWRGY